MGRPRRFNSYDGAVNQFRKTAENFGLSRQNLSGISSALKGTPKSAPTGQGGFNRDDSKLSLQFGGEIRQAIGFTASSNAISSGDLDITKKTDGSTQQTRGIIFVSPESGTSDTLDTITGKLYDGQVLILAGVSGNTITIAHNNGGAGGILCPDDTNYTLSDDECVILVDDVTAGTQSWRLISGGGGGGGLTEPLLQTITTLTTATEPTTTDIDCSIGNVYKVTLDEDITFDFTNETASKYQLIHIIIVQDGTGGWAVTWPAALTATPTVASGASEQTDVILYTIDQGTTWNYVLGTSGASVVGANKQLSNLGTTSINADLLPTSTATIDVGSTSLWYANLYSGTLNLGDATDNYTITGLPAELEIDYTSHVFTLTNSTQDVLVADANSVTISANTTLQIDDKIELIAITKPGTTTTSLIYTENLTNDELVLNAPSFGSVRIDVNGTECCDIGGALTQFDNDAGYSLRILRNDSTPTDDDAIGDFTFIGNSWDGASQGVSYQFGQIKVIQRDVTEGTADGEIQFNVLDNASLTEYMSLESVSGGAAVFFTNKFKISSTGDISWPSVSHGLNVSATNIDFDLNTDTDTFDLKFNGTTHHTFEDDRHIITDTSSVVLKLFKDASGIGGIGTHLFTADDSAGNETNYATIVGSVLDATNTGEDGELTINVMSNGTVENAIDMVGASTGLELGFFGSGTTVQPSSTGETTGFTAGSGTAVNDDSTFTGNSGTKAYTVGDIVKHLKALGLLASS